MNISVYSHYFSPEIGAPSARIYDLAQQWLVQGHQVQVVTCFPNHPTGKLYPGYRSRLYQHEQLDNIDIHRHWTYITPNKGFAKKTIGHISYLPSSLAFSHRHRSDLDVTVGSSPTFFAAMSAAAIAARRKIPFIMEVRDLWPAVFVELGVLRNQRIIRALERLELALYKQATKVVTVTDAFRENLIERGVPANKVVSIPNGADEDFWQPTPPNPELQHRLGLEGKFIALYIGAHGISQALGRILDSAALLQTYPDIHIVFVGEGAEKDELVKRAQQQGLSNVTFLEPVDKAAVKQFYALADVCLVPLRNIPLFDTFIPSKMFEMLAMARPVVASVRGEAADILQRSGGAIVVEPEDSRAIADAIVSLFNDPAQAQSLGQHGRQFVLDHYSRRSLASKYVQVINEARTIYRSKKR